MPAQANGLALPLIDTAESSPAPPSLPSILLENGTFMLLEDGTNILLE
jgi:hypothetical protein